MKALNKRVHPKPNKRSVRRWGRQFKRCAEDDSIDCSMCIYSGTCTEFIEFRAALKKNKRKKV